MTEVGGIAADLLCSYVARVERLDEERRALAQDIADIYKEARSRGFDVKALKAVIGRRRKGDYEVSEFDALVELYERALADGPSRARTHEGNAAAHNPETGEIIEPTAGAGDLTGSGAATPDSPHAQETASTPPGPTPVAEEAATSEADAPAGHIAANGGETAQPSDPLEIPTFLRRGHPDCTVEQGAT